MKMEEVKHVVANLTDANSKVYASLGTNMTTENLIKCAFVVWTTAILFLLVSLF